MNKREIKRMLKGMIPEMEVIYYRKKSIYRRALIGSFAELDPCGREDHDGFSKVCWDFWDRVGKAAEELGGWTDLETDSEKDTLMVYFYLGIKDE